MTGAKRNQETMKVTMKTGGGGSGGGIGAVVLLGGALATAALASAFVVGRNGRSSGHKGSPARDESDKAQECNVVDQPLIENKSPSSGEIKEIESDKNTAFLVSNQESTVDVKPIVGEMNGEKLDNICDKSETDSISDDHAVIEDKIPLLDEELQFEPQNDDGVTIELTNEDAADNGISKETQNLDEQVLSEEERTESEPTDEYDSESKETSHHGAVEITEKQPKPEGNHNEAVCYDEEEIKVVLVDNNEVEEKSEQEERHVVIDNGEMIFSESDSDDGQKAIQLVLESRVIEHENVNGDEKKVIVEIGKENEFVEESEEEEEEEEDRIEEQLEKEQEECDHPDELLVVEKHENPACLVNYPTVKEELILPENVEVTTKESDNYLEGEIEKEVEGEVVIISPENIESTEANKNETSLEFAVVGQEKQDEDEDVERDIVIEEINDSVTKEIGDDKTVIEEIEGSSETIYIEKNDSVTKENGDDQTVLSDEVRLVDREVGGKIQEDKAVKNGEHDSNDTRIIDEDSSFEQHQEKSEHPTLNSGKAFTVKNYMITNDRLTNSTNRRLIIAILSVMSSLSCSWFFGLSSVQLCLVVLLTMMISSMATEQLV